MNINSLTVQNLTCIRFRPNNDKDKQVYDLSQNYLKNNKANKDKYLDDLNIMLKRTSPEYKIDISKRLGIQAINGIIINENFYDLLDESYKTEGCHTSFIKDEEINLNSKRKNKRIVKGIKDLAQKLENMKPCIIRILITIK